MNRSPLDIEANFIEWLRQEKGLDGRSGRDILSRLRRAQKYADIYSSTKAKETIFRMDDNSEFDKLGKTIKSQMRHAVRLFFEFRDFYREYEPKLF